MIIISFIIGVLAGACLALAFGMWALNEWLKED